MKNTLYNEKYYIWSLFYFEYYRCVDYEISLLPAKNLFCYVYQEMFGYFWTRNSD